MSDSKTERELNLLFVLLNAKRPIEREEIRKRVPGYFGKSDEAFERAFERDKKMLRELIGAPVKTVILDKYHEDISGYTIDPEEWQLPEIRLTASERALLNLANSAWAQTQMSSALTDAAKRLGDDIEVEDVIRIDLAKQSEHLEKFLSAKSLGKCVEFTYYSKNSDAVDERLVSPWRVFLSDGNSYLIGFDQLKGEQRIFKISRILSEVKISSEDALELAPIDFSSAQIVAQWQGEPELLANATLSIARDRGGELRIVADEISNDGDFDLVVIKDFSKEKLIQLISKNCDCIKVIEPKSLAVEVNKLISQVSINEK